MIERKIVAAQVKNFLVDDYIRGLMKGSEYSHTEVVKTPLGDKVIVFCGKPGLIIGRKGANIKALTLDLRDKYGLSNPQIEIAEVPEPLMDANIVVEKVATSLERFGSNRFKGVMHKVMVEVMGAGALGIEIRISGKVPSSRAKAWKILSGYMKKNGDVSISGVKRASMQARLKTGVIGVQIRIMPRGLILPDTITVLTEDLKNFQNEEVVEDKEGVNAEIVETSSDDKPKKARKKSAKKKDADDSTQE